MRSRWKAIVARVRQLRLFIGLVAIVAEICYFVVVAASRWSFEMTFVLGTLAVLALATVATVSVLIYARLKGVNLHYLDFEMRNRRVEAEARNQRPPYGMQ